MSMPDETPAAVITLPCSTTRLLTGVAPNSASVSSAIQCVVASSPSRIPAAPSTSEPVHTEVVHSRVLVGVLEPADDLRVVPSARGCRSRPGTTITSGSGSSSRDSSATSASISVSVRFGPGSAAMKWTVAPGMRERTS